MTLSTQFLTILSMVGTGLFIGTSHETLRRFERIWLSVGLFRYSVEIVFWLTQAIIVYLVLFLVNEGVIRFFVFLALLLGYAMYQSLIAWWYRRVLDTVIDIGVRIFRWIVRLVHWIVIKPIVGLALFLWLIIVKLTQLLFMIIKVLLWPFLLIGRFLYRLLPKPVKQMIERFVSYFRKKSDTD